MFDDPAIGKRVTWLRSTFERLASMPLLSDDDFDYVVFEDLVPDAWSSLHEGTLDLFVSAGCITESMKAELLGIRSSFFALVDAAQADPALLLGDIRRDARWLDIAKCSQRILSGCGHDGTG